MYKFSRQFYYSSAKATESFLQILHYNLQMLHYITDNKKGRYLKFFWNITESTYR